MKKEYFIRFYNRDAVCILKVWVKELFKNCEYLGAEDVINTIMKNSLISIKDIEVFECQDVNLGFIGVANLHDLKSSCRFNNIH